MTNNNINNNEKKKKNFSKDRIVAGSLGLFLGALSTAGAFVAYINIAGLSTSSGEQSMQNPNGTPPEMPSGMSNGMPSGGRPSGTPPELPDGETPDGETPPELPDGETSSES